MEKNPKLVVLMPKKLCIFSLDSLQLFSLLLSPGMHKERFSANPSVKEAIWPF
jgi:hypothetical protein